MLYCNNNYLLFVYCRYVPALRPLRNCALVLNFPPTLPSRLASRLLEISVAQALKTDSSALMALCEKADNDIRSCLATLQVRVLINLTLVCIL